MIAAVRVLDPGMYRVQFTADATAQEIGETVAAVLATTGGPLIVTRPRPAGGDACGCPDDRCIGYHHDVGEPCRCVEALRSRP